MTANVDVEKQDKNVQFVSRFLTLEQMNEQFFQNQKEEYLLMNLRVKILNQWTEQSINELILMLETNEFPYPTTSKDTYILLERLFDFHWEEIQEPNLKRLWILVENAVLDERHNNLLKFHLLFFEKRKKEFIEFYQEIFKNPFYWLSEYINYYVGDLQISDDRVLKNYQQILSNPKVLFGAKYPAMIVLGKIGNASGEKFAQIIEENIFDSQEYIIKARTLVLKRIRTPAEYWKPCENCYFGRVRSQASEMISMRDCQICSGLGWVEN